MLNALAGDLRYSVRLLLKNPGFALVAVATLALGIGANTAIFSVADHVLLRPLAYRDAQRLYAVHEVVPKFSHIAPLIPVNAMHFAEWRRTQTSFERMALVSGGTMTLGGDGRPELVHTARVTPDLFPMLGVTPVLGRMLRADEDAPGRDGVVMIGHEVWERKFGASPGVLGRRILLDGSPYEIVGVLPADFRFPRLSSLYAMTVDEQRPQIWRPFAVRPDELSPIGDFNYACLVSVKPGVTLARASADLNAIQARVSGTLPEKVELQASLVPLREQITGRSRSGLQLLLAAVGVVLLVACVNVANLLLARVTGRRRELAVRAAVGARPSRLVAQVLVETLVLAVLGGAAGVALAFWAVDLIRANAPAGLPRVDEVAVDGRVLLFTMGLVAASGILSGLLPAWRFGRANPHDAMLASTRGAGAGARGLRVRHALVAAEVALSALCLAMGGLLLHSFARLVSVDAGFGSHQILAVSLELPRHRYGEDAQRMNYIRAVLERLGALPGVATAGVVNQLPLGGEGGNNLVAPEGFTGQISDRPIADVRQVNRQYFETMGIPLVSGRVFDEADRSHKVVLLSASTAARLFPGKDAVGRRVAIGDANADVAVAGIVGDVRGVSLDRAPSLTVYVPYWQQFYAGPTFVVRPAADPEAVSASVARALREIDPEIPVPAFRTMDEIVSASVADRRFQLRLVLLFGLSALLLASVGIYGVVAYSVAQRTGELGIRLALGATPARIRGLVLAQSLAPVLIGLACGLAASVGAARLLGSLLFGVGPADPATLAGVATVLLAVSVAATLGPAARATRVDPVVALRDE